MSILTLDSITIHSVNHPQDSTKSWCYASLLRPSTVRFSRVDAMLRFGVCFVLHELILCFASTAVYGSPFSSCFYALLRRRLRFGLPEFMLCFARFCLRRCLRRPSSIPRGSFTFLLIDWNICYFCLLTFIYFISLLILLFWWYVCLPFSFSSIFILLYQHANKVSSSLWSYHSYYRRPLQSYFVFHRMFLCTQRLLTEIHNSNFLLG